MKTPSRLPRYAVRQAAILLLVATLPAAFTAAFHSRRPAWKQDAARVAEVTPDQTFRWPGEVLFVDARSEEAFARKHIPGALPLTEERWEEQLARVVTAWRPGMRIVIYCDSLECNSSQAVAQRLRRELGIGDVRVLKGGWAAWRANEQP